MQACQAACCHSLRLAAPADFINKQVDTLENGLAAKQKDLVQHQRKVTADLAGEPRMTSLCCTGFARALKLSWPLCVCAMSVIDLGHQYQLAWSSFLMDVCQLSATKRSQWLLTFRAPGHEQVFMIWCQVRRALC